MTPQAALARGQEELALGLAPATLEKLHAYRSLLAKWNRSYNLTAIRDPLEMVSHHLLDSLAVLPHLATGTRRLADVGSGAGLPGIPLAIAREALAVTLVEASQKKAAFLRQACIELGLGNATVHEGRVEKWQPRERFDIVVSRAFAELAGFVSACRHLVAEGGRLVAMKGRLSQGELDKLPEGVRTQAVALRVPLLDAERHLVFCELTQ